MKYDAFREKLVGLMKQTSGADRSKLRRILALHDDNVSVLPLLEDITAIENSLVETACARLSVGKYEGCCLYVTNLKKDEMGLLPGQVLGCPFWDDDRKFSDCEYFISDETGR